MTKNVLGIGYIALIAFLWLLAYADYSFGKTRSVSLRTGKAIPVEIMCVRVAFLVLGGMAALRGFDIGNDTLAYYKTYVNVSKLGFQGEFRMERGYIALNYLLSKLFSNNEIGYRILLLIATLVSYWPLERWIEKNSETYGVCILAFYFLSNGGYMSATRQSIANGIVLIGLFFLQDKKPVKFAVCVLIAILFHKTALIAFLFLVFYNRVFNGKWMMAIMGVASLLTVTNLAGRITAIFRPVTIYSTFSDGSENGLTVIVMSIMYCCLLFLRLFEAKKDQNSDAVLLETKESFYVFGITMSFALTLISLRVPVISRLCGYFSLAGLPYISNVMNRMKNQGNALLIKVVFCVALWAYSLTVLILRPEWQHLWPYHFFWET